MMTGMMMKINVSLQDVNGSILSKESLFSMSDTETGFKDQDKYTRFYGSLVYLKQPPLYSDFHL